MSRIRPSFVLGYHGCDKDIGLKAVNGEIPLTASDGTYHWMGHGIYFWENDPLRAYEWAKQKAARGACKNPYVIGAIIDLGHCLDLLIRENAPIVREAYESLKEMKTKATLPMPVNMTAPKDNSKDLVLRHLDCAVIDHLHQIIQEKNGRPFDSVRAAFTEGDPIFEGGKIHAKNHVQIAVCNSECIHGYFVPLERCQYPFH